MNTSRLFLKSVMGLIVLTCAAISPAQSVDPWPGDDPIPSPINPTITVSLTLPRYTFWLDMMPSPEPFTREYGSFPAVFKLVNRSEETLLIDLALLAGIWKPVIFVMRNAEGREVWRSYKPDPRIMAPLVLKTVALENGKSWRITAKVPLAPSGKPLKTGAYTLEAFINGTPRYAATAPFKIGYAF